MAQAFSPKQFFKKLTQPLLLSELYKTHEIDSFFEITENTPRKNATSIMMEFHASLSPEQRMDTEEELASAFSLGNQNGVYILEKVLKERGVSPVTTIECHSDVDFALYHFLFSKEVFTDALFLNTFYLRPNYMLYEAKEVDLVAANLSLTELGKEFKRIANKDDRSAECAMESRQVDDILYILATFDIVGQGTKEARIVYLPKDKEVLISYTGPKYDKLVYLDTFLRIVCKDGYTEKIESFDLSAFKDNGFDFTKTNRGTPLLRFKVKSITFSYGEEKQKKKIRLTLPATQADNGLTPLYATTDELGMTDKLRTSTIENIALSFSFTDRKKADKSVNVQVSISPLRSSLCPLFHYHRYARSLLKQAGIEKGFVEAAKKEKEDVAKKWDL